MLVAGTNFSKAGFASLSAIDAAQSQAEFMLGIVEQEQIKTGIALEASLLVLDYAFNHEGLHKLCSFVYGNNPLAQKNTLALGFKNDGVLEKHLQLQTSLDFLDVYQNSLLQEQFRNNRRLSRLSSRLLGVDVTRKPRHRRSDEFDLNASFELKP